MDKVSIQINGVMRTFIIGDAEGCVKPSETLVHTLRDRLDLTGTKIGCDHGGLRQLYGYLKWRPGCVLHDPDR